MFQVCQQARSGRSSFLSCLESQPYIWSTDRLPIDFFYKLSRNSESDALIFHIQLFGRTRCFRRNTPMSFAATHPYRLSNVTSG